MTTPYEMELGMPVKYAICLSSSDDDVSDSDTDNVEQQVPNEIIENVIVVVGVDDASTSFCRVLTEEHSRPVCWR